MKCKTQDWDYQYSDEDINGTDFEDGCDDEDDDDGDEHGDDGDDDVEDHDDDDDGGAVDEDGDGDEVTSGVKRGWVEKKELALPTSRLWR